jgi:hypothetical protein
MLCSNTHYLNEYEHNQALLEKDWELSKSEKQEAVIAYAIKIMVRLVPEEVFHWVFKDYYVENDDGENIYNSDFTEALDNWNFGFCEYSVMIYTIAEKALTMACELLYDVEVDEVFDNLSKAKGEVVVYGG